MATQTFFTQRRRDPVEVKLTDLAKDLRFFVKYNDLSPEEQLIHRRHIEALEKGSYQYQDPLTGYSVFTRLAHLKRGECCGSACRHCPYGHKSVPKDKPKKNYNSAFYI